MFCNQEFKEASEVSLNDMPQAMDTSCCTQNMCAPIERCVQREFHHCIEHVVPINTRFINHHIYHHVYKPVYTCCEENIASETCN